MTLHTIMWTLLLSLGACSLSESDDNPPATDPVVREFVFSIDNKDPSHFGYENYDNDEDITAKSLFVSSRYAFVVDAYHSNVKRIDLASGDKICSPRLGSRPRQWLRDLIVFNDKVFVSDDFDSIFVLTISLKRLSSIHVDRRSVKFFVDSESDTLQVLLQSGIGGTADRIIGIDKSGSVCSNSATVDESSFSPYQTAHGKVYRELEEDGGRFIETASTRIEMQMKLPKLSDRFDGVNVEFNDETLAFFDVNEAAFRLYVCRFP